MNGFEMELKEEQKIVFKITIIDLIYAKLK